MGYHKWARCAECVTLLILFFVIDVRKRDVQGTSRAKYDIVQIEPPAPRPRALDLFARCQQLKDATTHKHKTHTHTCSHTMHGSAHLSPRLQLHLPPFADEVGYHPQLRLQRKDQLKGVKRGAHTHTQGLPAKTPSERRGLPSLGIW